MVAPDEVQITKVVTVQTGDVSDNHNPTPNWVYGDVPNPGWDLRIEAEAGSDIGNGGSPYMLYIHANPLSQPNIFPNLRPVGGDVGIPEAFNAANGWHLDPHEGTYKKNWVFPLPWFALFAFEANHTYEYVVSLIEAAGANRRVACVGKSDPLLIII